mmetsp:Transcript_8381/g.35070  ORF Transcript_8381/g.35070 Transcript_8381/m.35070 type:complete len:308 (-) Transcript_8381:818-1741(-)
MLQLRRLAVLWHASRAGGRVLVEGGHGLLDVNAEVEDGRQPGSAVGEAWRHEQAAHALRLPGPDEGEPEAFLLQHDAHEGDHREEPFAGAHALHARGAAVVLSHVGPADDAFRAPSVRVVHLLERGRDERPDAPGEADAGAGRVLVAEEARFQRAVVVVARRVGADDASRVEESAFQRGIARHGLLVHLASLRVIGFDEDGIRRIDPACKKGGHVVGSCRLVHGHQLAVRVVARQGPDLNVGREGPEEQLVDERLGVEVGRRWLLCHVPGGAYVPEEALIELVVQGCARLNEEVLGLRRHAKVEVRR